MSYLPSSPDLENIAGLLAKYPRRGILLFKLLEDIKGCFLPLGKGTRELIIAYTCDLNQSESCYKAHKSLSKELGIEESVYSQLKLDIDSAIVDEKLKPLLRFVKKLTFVNCMNSFTMGVGIDKKAAHGKQTQPVSFLKFNCLGRP